MSKRERLQRWVSLLEQNPTRRLCTLSRTEFVPPGHRDELQRADTALSVWNDGKVVLLGDACHPMKPHMGQGAAMAAEDAAILVRCLEHFGWEDFKSAFRMYQDNRKARTADVQHHSYLNQWFRHVTDPTWVYGYDPINVELGVPGGTAD